MLKVFYSRLQSLQTKSEFFFRLKNSFHARTWAKVYFVSIVLGSNRKVFCNYKRCEHSGSARNCTNLLQLNLLIFQELESFWAQFSVQFFNAVLRYEIIFRPTHFVSFGRQNDESCKPQICFYWLALHVFPCVFVLGD